MLFDAEEDKLIIFSSAQYCEPKDVEKMINTGADPNAPDFDGFTPLFYAAIALNALTGQGYTLR